MPVGNATGAFASRTITEAGASITFPPVALAMGAPAPLADFADAGTDLKANKKMLGIA